MLTLLFCPAMEPLAQRIAAAEPGVRLGSVRFERFADGFPDLFVEDVKQLRNTDVAFLASFDTPADVFPQLSLLFELPRYGVRSFKVVLPYFPTGTMERVDRDGRIATAATLARMLSQIPLSMSGPAQIVIYDIHALQERFYFNDQVVPRLETAVPLLEDELAGLDKPALAFPDEGARKRFGALLPGFDHLVCMKMRDRDKRSVVVREGEPRGRHCVIVDDLVQSGGTLLATREALVARGAAAVSAFATHGVFPGEAWRRFTDAGFADFWLTDSCPSSVARLAGVTPFRILSLAPSLAAVLLDRES